MDLARLHERLAAGGLRVAGVLSGTSADGIDVGVARLSREGGAWRTPELRVFRTVPFEADLGAELRAVLEGERRLDLGGVARLDRDLGRAFGRAVREVAADDGGAPDLVGSHGQTVWHHDDREPSGPATLQLGDLDFVAAEAGCPVVGDFRQADVAAGGGGAPLSPYADDVVFAAAQRPLTVLNLGGIANLTWIDGDARRAFDVGPANALLDGLARRDLGTAFDRDGACALAGQADAAFVERLLAHPFLDVAPPRSTGRDTFGAGWLASMLEEAPARAEDRARSACAAIARAVAEARERWLPETCSPLLVAGGGAHHPALMAELEAACAGPVRPSSAVGVDPDAREALVFAVLAARWLVGEPVTDPGVTGARVGAVLGKLALGRA